MTQTDSELQQERDIKMIKSLMERGLKLPPQPKVVEELQKCQRRQERDVRVVARIIAADAGISAMLFRIVQSPAYRSHQPFASLEKILQSLGIDQVINLVQAMALATISSSRAHRKMYERFWTNSLAVAQLAMLVAEERAGVCNISPDQAFLAGIFYDCGVPLLMERFPSYCRSVGLSEQEFWFNLAAEDGKYQTDHSVVGYFVAKHWKLPEFVCDAIRFHHDLGRLQEPGTRGLVAILQTAIYLYCRNLQIDNPEWAANQPLVFDELAMDEAGFNEFVDEMLERYNTVSQ